jgi:NAD(P)-dependent dehydrogenase (short-subunit alcohol dehydrogenase family)
MAKNLAGKTALVTTGSRGIGAAIASRPCAPTAADDTSHVVLGMRS